MDNSIVRNSLQDLIIRLQDAEKGFNEISKAISDVQLQKQLKGYAGERHNMHKALESYVALLGGDAKVKTSFLGDLHRMFIDIKLNSTNAEDELDAVVNEVERGASVLISDYDKVISDVELPSNIARTLMSQRATVQAELSALGKKNVERSAVEA